MTLHKMQNLVDEAATMHRAKSPTMIWTDVLSHIKAKHGNIPMQMLTRNQVINRVKYIRHGGGSADRLRDIEELDLALTSDRLSPFLAFNTPVYHGTIQHRLTGWGHPGLYKLLRNDNLHLFVDATFAVVPTPFKQLLILMVKDMAQDLYLPVFHVLMTSKSTFLYRYAFQLIVLVVGCKIRPSNVYCDFEAALISAIKGGT